MQSRIAELSKLPKKQLVYLATHRCRHRHRYISHYCCYQQDQQLSGEKVGFLDIEASNLKADFGIILSYCIKEQGGKIYGRAITPAELKSTSHDKALVRECVADIQRFDRLITFYGARYDIPFVRSRALYHRVPFPEYGSCYHTDIYFWVRNKMKLHGNRLQFACDFLQIPSKGHRLNGGMWTKALTGDKKSLDYILIHNKEDVVATEKLFNKLAPFHKLIGSLI